MRLFIKIYCILFIFSANRVTSYGLYDGVHTKFWDVWKRSSKTPFILAFYTSSLTTVGLWYWFIKPELINESEQCAPCLLAKTYGIMAGCGIAMPLITTPWLVHAIVSFLVDGLKALFITKFIVQLLAFFRRLTISLLDIDPCLH